MRSEEIGCEEVMNLLMANNERGRLCWMLLETGESIMQMLRDVNETHQSAELDWALTMMKHAIADNVVPNNSVFVGLELVMVQLD